MMIPCFAVRTNDPRCRSSSRRTGGGSSHRRCRGRIHRKPARNETIANVVANAISPPVFLRIGSNPPPAQGRGAVLVDIVGMSVVVIVIVIVTVIIIVIIIVLGFFFFFLFFIDIDIIVVVIHKETPRSEGTEAASAAASPLVFHESRDPTPALLLLDGSPGAFPPIVGPGGPAARGRNNGPGGQRTGHR